MLDMNEVERTIVELENGNTNFSVCAKLADLYSVRDHIMGKNEAYDQSYSRSAAPVSAEKLDLYGDSDFLDAIAGKDSSAVWAVIDELMSTLKVTNVKVYDSVLRRIGKIG